MHVFHRERLCRRSRRFSRMEHYAGGQSSYVFHVVKPQSTCVEVQRLSPTGVARHERRKDKLIETDPEVCTFRQKPQKGVNVRLEVVDK